MGVCVCGWVGWGGGGGGGGRGRYLRLSSPLIISESHELQLGKARSSWTIHHMLSGSSS